jgi:hypothetical protein
MNSGNTPIETYGTRRGGHATASASPASRFALAVAGAGVLLLVGTSLQMGEFAYGSFVQENSWAISMTIHALWAMLAGLLGRLVSPEVLRYWPLLLAMTGCSILLAGLRSHGAPAADEARRREGYRG